MWGIHIEGTMTNTVERSTDAKRRNDTAWGANLKVRDELDVCPEGALCSVATSMRKQAHRALSGRNRV